MNRKELVEKLELVSRALADNDIIPIFKCFCFDGQTVKSYNDALAIIAPCKMQEKFCVNGQVLLGLLSNSHTENVEFLIEDRDLTVKTGRSTFKLPWFPREDFLFKKPDDTNFVCNITKDFLAGLSACLMTSSKDISQAAFMGVCLQGESLYSTDGDAITRYGKPNKDGAGNMLPNSFCETLVKLGHEGMLSTNREWVKAKLNDGLIVYGRLIAVDTPIDYEMWIKKTLPSEKLYVGMPKGLDRALSRARVIADPESAKTVLTIRSGRINLVTETSMGVVRDNVLWDGIHDMEANISAELMQRCISLCNEIIIFPNCCCFRNGDKLFILTSNMGK